MSCVTQLGLTAAGVSLPGVDVWGISGRGWVISPGLVPANESMLPGVGPRAGVRHGPRAVR
jgi:hypothetical protein